MTVVVGVNIGGALVVGPIPGVTGVHFYVVVSAVIPITIGNLGCLHLLMRGYHH